ncbi:phage tail protein [Clostridium uliginosum]|uniref:Phage tail fibre repeat-containing protein n=1 Tax=Clostridium uliginosum TaxID=119641 RepID=A0A1I1RXH0_9CLOT|nr:phage tail protein [Clostridium uliginosum]SFD38955.1 Phage tail fibre repeat-containing protein [Clostridium uliginosum]
MTKKVDNIKVPDGTTSQKGIVKLNDTVTSASTIETATANAVKTAYDKGNEALNKANQAFQYANNGKTNIANVIGYVTGNNTHQEIVNEIQYDKNILVNNLNAKGAVITEINKFGEITVEQYKEITKLDFILKEETSLTTNIQTVTQ